MSLQFSLCCATQHVCTGLQCPAHFVWTFLQLTVSRNDLYLPTNPHYIVKQVIPESATPMQSAAKVPILVAFEVSPPTQPHARSSVCRLRIVRHDGRVEHLHPALLNMTCAKPTFA